MIRKLLPASLLGALLLAASAEAQVVKTLAQLRSEFAAGTLASNTLVEVQNITVLSKTDQVNSATSYSFQISDGTGYVTVFGGAAGSGQTTIQTLLATANDGDSVSYIRGNLGINAGVLQISATATNPLSFGTVTAGSGAPAPATITTAPFNAIAVTNTGNPDGEALESSLVRIENAYAVSPVASWAGVTNYTFRAGGKNFTVRVSRSDMDLVGQAFPSGVVNLVGIFSQNNAEYQILLRSTADVTPGVLQDGLGSVVVSNATVGSALNGTPIFEAATPSSATITLTGSTAGSMTQISLTLPEALAGASLSASGSAIGSVAPVISGSTYTWSGAGVDLNGSSSVVFTLTGINLPTPVAPLLGDHSISISTAKAGGTLTEIAALPLLNVPVPLSAALRSVDATGVSLYKGRTIAVTGVATVTSNGALPALGTATPNQVNAYLEDGGYALNIFAASAPGGTVFPSGITRGYRYLVRGKLDQYNGLTELVPASQADIIDLGYVGEPVPTVVLLSELLANPELYEGRLVSVLRVGKNIPTGGTWPSAAANTTLTVREASTGAVGTLFLYAGAFGPDQNAGSEPVWPVSVTGIFSQYDTSSPYTAGYQLQPRQLEDISGAGYVDGLGSVTMTNATSGSLSGTTIFQNGATSALLTFTGDSRATTTQIQVALPAGSTGLTTGGVTLAGDAFASASASVSGSTLTITGANLTASTTGTATLANFQFAAPPLPPAEGADGYNVFSVSTASAGGTLAPVARPPYGNVALPLSYLRVQNARLIPELLGKTVAVQGTTSAGERAFDPINMETFFQSGTAGASLYKGGTAANASATPPVEADPFGLSPALAAGETVVVLGEVSQSAGTVRVLPLSESSIYRIGYETLTPVVVTVADVLANAEAYEGRLVQINSLNKDASSAAWPTVDTNGTLTVTDGTGTLALRIDRHTDFNGTAEPTWPVNVVGIFNQFLSPIPADPEPLTGGYQLLPRGVADVTAAAVATPFETWQAANFSLPAEANLAEATFDADGDGLSNLLEYAFGSNPRAASTGAAPVAGLTAVSGSTYVTLSFTRVKTATDLVYRVLGASTLGATGTELWTSTATPYPSEDGATRVETVTDTVPVTAGSPRFLWVEVTKP